VNDDELWRALVRLVEEVDPVSDGLVERVQRHVAVEWTWSKDEAA
jgi:hypothetical protein